MCLRVSTSFGHVSAQITSWTTLSLSKSLTFGWFIEVLSGCFNYLVFKSAPQPVSTGTSASMGSRVNVIFFPLWDNWTEENSREDFLRAFTLTVSLASRLTLLTSDLSHLETRGLTRSIWLICGIFRPLAEFIESNELSLCFSIKLLFRIQGRWTVKRIHIWTRKNLDLGVKHLTILKLLKCTKMIRCNMNIGAS